jgi:hypothetical protein
MADLTLFVGMDVHKKTISVAMVEGSAGAEVRFYVRIPTEVARHSGMMSPAIPI